MLFMLAVIDATESFNELLNTQMPLMVKFYAEWCSHCGHMEEKYARLGEIADARVLVAEVDCVQNQVLCQEQGIKGYPTIHYYRAGVFVTAYTQPKEAAVMAQWLVVQLAKP